MDWYDKIQWLTRQCPAFKLQEIVIAILEKLSFLVCVLILCCNPNYAPCPLALRCTKSRGGWDSLAPIHRKGTSASPTTPGVRSSILANFG